MNRDRAIYYAKRLVKRVMYEMEHNEDTRTMFIGINDPNDEYKDLAEKQLDVWAEWVFPDDTNEQENE